jgi:hypothetical protein
MMGDELQDAGEIWHRSPVSRLPSPDLRPGNAMEAIVPLLNVVNIAVTVAILFAVFRAREGFAPALLGISLGRVCFLVPLYFLGPWWP